MFKNTFWIALTLMATVAGFSAPLQAERHSLASINLQAEAFIAQYPYDSPYPVAFTLGHLDKRLNLKPCRQNLDIRFTRKDRSMGNTSLTIRCASPVAWQIHLPVRVQVFQDVLVNRVALVKGQAIEERLVSYRKEDISRLQRGFYRRADALAELQARRHLAAGTILDPSNLSPRQLVKSGQRVTIILDIAGLRVKSSGQALQSASRGQVIKVKNSQSKRIVEGVVTAPGQITVTL